jgi:ketosteroid isomerase-like protein
MRKTFFSLLIAGACLFSGGAPAAQRASLTDLQKQVADTERAFAQTMAKRDHAAFVSFLAEDTVFFSGPKPLRGKSQVAEWWKRFYEKPEAPFSWAPEKVEILNSGELAMSTGPVRDPKGNLIGSFTSVWRRESPGVWRIVFDNGCDCECAGANQ